MSPWGGPPGHLKAEDKTPRPQPQRWPLGGQNLPHARQDGGGRGGAEIDSPDTDSKHSRPPGAGRSLGGHGFSQWRVTLRCSRQGQWLRWDEIWYYAHFPGGAHGGRPCPRPRRGAWGSPSAGLGGAGSCRLGACPPDASPPPPPGGHPGRAASTSAAQHALESPQPWAAGLASYFLPG